MYTNDWFLILYLGKPITKFRDNSDPVDYMEE